jgi:hypothetical protein
MQSVQSSPLNEIEEFIYVNSLVYDGDLKIFPCQIILTKMKLRKMGLSGHIMSMEETRNAYKFFVGDYEESGSLGKYNAIISVVG